MVKYDLKFEKISSVPGFSSAVLPMCQRKSSVVLLWKSGKSSAFLPVRQKEYYVSTQDSMDWTYIPSTICDFNHVSVV